MGVQGLNSYIQKQAGLSAHELRNCHLVIDAANFVHHLHSERCSGCSFEFGGDYDNYSQFVRHIFTKFAKNSVVPLFVFDGASDWAGDKLAEQKRRMQQRIGKLQRLRDGNWRSSRLLPMAVYECFSDCVHEFQFACATVANGDADEQMAALANSLGCPVLTNDSDFCIFDLPGGVILTSTVSFDFDTSRSDQPLSCRLFRPETCGLKRELLPISATLMGNEYCRLSDEEFAKVVPNSNAQWRVQPSLQWTHRFASRHECLARVEQILGGGDRMEAVRSSLRHYELRRGLMLNPDTKQLQFSPECAPPQNIDRKLLTREKLTFILDVVQYQQVMLPNVIELVEAESVFEASKNVRLSAYALEMKLAGVLADSTTVTEFSRLGSRVSSQRHPIRSHSCRPGDTPWRCILRHLSAESDPLADKVDNRGVRLQLYIIEFAHRSLQQQQQPAAAAAMTSLLTVCLTNCLAADRQAAALRSLAQSHRPPNPGSTLLQIVHCCNAVQAATLSVTMLLHAHNDASGDSLCQLPHWGFVFPGRTLCGIADSILAGRVDWLRALLPQLVAAGLREAVATAVADCVLLGKME